MTSLISVGEKTGTDQFVRRLIEALGVTYWEQGDGPAPIKKGLVGASKSASGKGNGKPEFAFSSDRFLVVVEDKRDGNKTISEVDGVIDLNYPARSDYAVNGAVHYARKIIDQSAHYTEIFAVGITGTEHHHQMVPVFVSTNGQMIRLDEVDNLTMFHPENIAEFHRVAVLGEPAREELELAAARKIATNLHELMRNYASIEGDRKATTVSAILLALKDDDRLVESLRGRDTHGATDGCLIYDAAERYLRAAELQPQQKIGALLDQFRFIKDHVSLNKKHPDLGGITPLRKFAYTLDEEVLHKITTSTFDILGNFYGEFVKYGGSDGNALGIVLTPHHITTLMADLIEVNKDDYLLDPCSGTAGYLIAGMGRMMKDAGDDEAKREEIREHRLFGIELQDKLFAIGTTNMILRGDGKANFQRHNFFDLDADDLRGEHGFTKVLINPPYSQAKSAQTRHLSEMSFIERSLSMLNTGGRLAAIVPQSVMVGKTKEDKALKKKVLAHHTLDAVITMNPETFHGVGTHTVIAVFTAGVPHPATKRVSFIDFQKDGYRTLTHRGLVGDGTQQSRRQHLLNVLSGDEDDDTKFIVKTTITADDEWQHSYFYFNDEPPTLEEFEAVVADYVTWQVDMHTHGRGHLFAAKYPVETDGVA